MNAALVIQAVILVLVAMACAGVALRRLLPGTSHRMQATLARALGRPSRSRALRALGVWLQPAEARAGGCGSGGGCGSCGGCGSGSGTGASADDALPLEFDTTRRPRT